MLSGFLDSILVGFVGLVVGSVVLRLRHFPTALKVEEFSEMGAKTASFYQKMQRLYRGGRRTKLSQLSGLVLGFWEHMKKICESV